MSNGESAPRPGPQSAPRPGPQPGAPVPGPPLPTPPAVRATSVAAPVPAAPATATDEPGAAEVDRVLHRLLALDELSVAEHAAAYDALHRDLAEILADAAPEATSRPGGAPGLPRGR